eukprot:scaffold3052_cov389-Prasinococcus_capsulatus_cf.AAC.4
MEAHEALDFKQNIPIRSRRNRKNAALRQMFCETETHAAVHVSAALSRALNVCRCQLASRFIHEEDHLHPIGAMPGCSRLPWKKELVDEVGKGLDYGINNVILFPAVPDAEKTPYGDECYNPDGLVPRAIKAIKDKYPDVNIYTDVALDPYNSDGHDGIVNPNTGEILNDPTVYQLCKQAVMQADAGADVVAPSDMQDGRVSAIRAALDQAGHYNVGIMAYTAKYASAFYGPFREALESNPRFGDKKTYQMDPGNWREAIRECLQDETEGADILMVKPAMPYLDIIRHLHDNSKLPVAAYQVSGEYAMIKAAAEKGWLDEKKCALEALTSIKRAGANVILTYYAIQAAEWLAGEGKTIKH